MKIEIDLKEIKRQAKVRENENIRFRSFLKGKDDKKIDRIVHHLNRDISAKIDCQQCVNCCKELSSQIEEEDIEKLTQATNLDKETVVEKYLEEDEKEYFFKKTPCTFLDGNSCSIYSKRPGSCESYPHLHKKEFIFRLWGVLHNYGICPIVYNVLEELKVRTRFRK